MARGTSFRKRLEQRIHAFWGGSQIQQPDAALALERACREFRLNPDKSSDRRKLLKELAFVCFPPSGKAGRRRKWTPERLCQLLSDVDQTRSQYECSEKKACELMARKVLFDGRYKGQKPETLRRRLQDATDPKRNAVLDTMVDNRLTREKMHVHVRRRATRPRSDKQWRAYLRGQERARQREERTRQRIAKKCIALISSSWRRRA
jgi:hypothetical protein